MAAKLPPCQVNMEILLSFMEFLHQNSLASSHIANDMAALRAFHIVHALPTTAFKDERIPLFLKSLKIQAPFSPPARSYIDISTPEAILVQCEKFPYPAIFRPLYLLCFFSFLRLSKHGTLKLDAVWAYLSSLPSATSHVFLAFQQSLAL